MSTGNGNDRDRRRGDDAFAERAAALFDESVQALDGETRSRLNRGRQRALEAAAGARPAMLWRAWVPAGGVAAIAAVAVAMLLWNGAEMPGSQAATIAADFEILMDEDSLEMLEELEFYSWLDSEDDTGGDDGSEHVG